MLTLVIWQPWASLVMVGAKPFEFRDKSYLDRSAYRIHPNPDDRVVIQAGARPVRPAEVEDLLTRLGTDADTTGLIADRARELLLRVRAAHKYRVLPLGAGLGTAMIGAPRNAATIFGRKVDPGVHGLPADSDRGDFNWAWPLGSLRRWDEPVPVRGQQGFYAWPYPMREAA